MVLAVTSAPSDELLTVEEAKRHLRIWDDTHDDEIALLIRAARDYCERFTQRTFRKAVTRTLKLDGWWCDPYDLPFPPLIDVTSITYYDSAGVSQTLAASNYHEELPTNGGGRIVWADGYVLPNIFSRPDAITITFTTGYADANALPPVALHAFKTTLTELWAAGTESEIKAAIEGTKRLLAPLDWTGYA